jgi:hypothetical protein
VGTNWVRVPVSLLLGGDQSKEHSPSCETQAEKGETLTTPNLGLLTPAASAIARLWSSDPVTAADAIAEQNNNVINQVLNLVELDTYSPSLTATTTNPNLGADGTTAGTYLELPGGFILGYFTIVFSGAGAAAGTGTYLVSLPVALDTTFHSSSIGGGTVHDILGKFTLRDGSTDLTSMTGIVRRALAAETTLVRLTPEGFSGKAADEVTSSSPFTWASGDALSGNFVYKAS